MCTGVRMDGSVVWCWRRWRDYSKCFLSTTKRRCFGNVSVNCVGLRVILALRIKEEKVKK